MNQRPTSKMPSRNEFDEEDYLQNYPDIAIGVGSGAIASGWQHFALHGFSEGRLWNSKPDPLIGVSCEISPHDEMLYGNKEHYFDVGESALHCIESALFSIRRKRCSIKAVLDFPCGHGRVMRFLRKAFPEAVLTGCDLNEDGVNFCAKTFGSVPVLSKDILEEIPLKSEFDLIWCGSLLTHFPEKKCSAFLDLFRRLLRPGGILVFTTHGRHCEHGLVTGKNGHGLNDQQVTALLTAYRASGFGYVDYTRNSNYGFSLSHPSFVMSQFVHDPEWQLISFHENGWDKRQDVISIRKKFPEN